MSTSAPAVLDRVNTLVASSPYHYTRAREPFGVDQQPAGELDRCYYVGMELVESRGNLGYSQEERWLVTIGVARMLGGDPHAAQRALTVDVHSLTATLARESTAQLHHFEDGEFSSEIFDPEDDDSHVVGAVSGIVNFERAL